MKTWMDIETLAENMGISRRTAYRRLKEGEIRRKKQDGRMVFVLDEELSDNDTVIGGDTTQMTHSDAGDTFDTSKKHYGRSVSDRPVSSLVRGLEEEIQKVRLSRELGKERAATNEWQEGQDKQRKEKAEQERILRLDELQIREGQRLTQEREAKARAKKQRIKNEIFSSDWVGFLSSQHRSRLIVEIEKALSQVDVEGLPFDELLMIAQGAADRVKEEAQRERDRIVQELQEKQAKEAIGYGETILKAIQIGAGLPSS